MLNPHDPNQTIRPFPPKIAEKITELLDPTNGQDPFGTGTKRDPCPTRFDLVPMRGLRRAAETAAHGAVKYGPRNWEKGIPISNCLDHAMAHIAMYLTGDRSEDHLGHATWNLMAACDSEERWPALNADLPQLPQSIQDPS